MHFDDSVARPHANSENLPWWKGLTSYQWFVFIVASLGWLFDTMDQQLFNLARKPAVTELLWTPRRATRPRSASQRIRRLRDHDLHDRLGARAASSSASWATGSAGPRRCC